MPDQTPCGCCGAAIVDGRCDACDRAHKCGAREHCPGRGIDDVCEMPAGHAGRHQQTRDHGCVCSWENEARR